jgi:hypothetical protein
MMERLAMAEGMKPKIPQARKSCDPDISVTTKSIASSETIMESPSPGLGNILFLSIPTKTLSLKCQNDITPAATTR